MGGENNGVSLNHRGSHDELKLYLFIVTRFLDLSSELYYTGILNHLVVFLSNNATQ